MRQLRTLFIGGTATSPRTARHCSTSADTRSPVVTRGNAPVPASYRSVKADRKNLDAMRRALDGVSVDVVINFLGYDLPDIETDYELFAGRFANTSSSAPRWFTPNRTANPHHRERARWEMSIRITRRTN